MEASFQTLFKLFATLVMIMDPIGNVPIFLALTARFTKRDRMKVATLAVAGAAVILLTFGLSGDAILFFGISLPAFQLAGGFIFFLYALQMLNLIPENLRTSEAEREESLQKEHIAIVPLATPLLAGPGAITTILVWQHDPKLALSLPELIAVTLAVSLLIWLVFLLGQWLRDLLGLAGIGVVTRIMGLLLSVLAMEMVLRGLRAAI